MNNNYDNDNDDDNEDNWEDMENEDDEYYNEQNIVNNEIINNEIVNNNIINNIQIVNIINNINNLNNVNNNFDGYPIYKQGCIECLYCGKYVSEQYLLVDTCAHCWGFCFSGQFDLENFNYTGDHPKDKIVDFLKLTYKSHPKTCNSMDCVYSKIDKLVKEKKLNRELGELLGLIEPIKKEEVKQKCYTFTNKKRNLKINFKLSNISI
jgi:hypothetical protein